MLAASPQHRFNPLLARHALRREGGQQKRQTGYSAPPPQQQTAASAPAGYGAPAPTCTTVYEEECKQVNNKYTVRQVRISSIGGTANAAVLQFLVKLATFEGIKCK